MLVMELQSKQSANQDVSLDLDKFGKLKDEHPSNILPIIDHALMIEGSDYFVGLHLSHLFS